MICKHCGEYTGEFFSELDTHLWVKHPEKVIKFLKKQMKVEKK